MMSEKIPESIIFGYGSNNKHSQSFISNNNMSQFSNNHQSEIKSKKNFHYTLNLK